MVSTLQIISYSDWGANYSKLWSGKRRGKGMFLLPTSSYNIGAELRSIISQPSPWAQQMSMYVHCGIQRCCLYERACLCLSSLCQDEPEACSTPLPLHLYPVFPMKEIWASKAEEHQRVPAAAVGPWQQRQGTLLHTCPMRQMWSLRLPVPVPLCLGAPTSRRLQGNNIQGIMGTLMRAAGHGRWHEQEQAQRAGTVPASWTFLDLVYCLPPS